MFFWVAMCYNLYKSMFVREVSNGLQGATNDIKKQVV